MIINKMQSDVLVPLFNNEMQNKKKKKNELKHNKNMKCHTTYIKTFSGIWQQRKPRF